MKKTRQRFVAGQIKRIASGYTQCSSVLNPYLSIEVERISSIEPEVRKILDVIETEGLYTVGDDNEASSTSDDESVEEEDKEISVSEDMRIVTSAVINIGDDETQTDDANEIDWKELLGEELKLSGEELTNENDIPDWLLDSFRGGKVHSCVMDILTLRTYFCVPQIEEYAYPHSHQISLAILRVIAGLLLESNDILLRYWTRNNKNKLDWFTVEPITATNFCNKFPSLKRLPETPLSIRKQIFMEALSLEKELISVPCEWELFVATTVFWLKNMKDPCVSVYHLHTLVMCIVCINLIDSHLGRYRIKRTFTKKYGKLLSAKEQQMKASKSIPNPASTVKLDINEEKSTISDCLKNVLKEDCIVIFNSILPYHHISEQLKIKPKHFDRTIVHAFSQFQSCFHLALVLNSVLNFPIEHCFVSKFFSGTFIYNMYTNLSKRSNLDAYIETFFSRVPRILQLYKQIINFILSLVPDTMFTETITKMRKKKKKPKSPLVLTSQVDKCDNSEEELFVDENNKFSLLSVNATS